MKKLILFTCLAMGGCVNIIDPIKNPMTVFRIETSSKHNCIYQIQSHTSIDREVIEIIDTIGKYKIGDTLIITKK